MSDERITMDYTDNFAIKEFAFEKLAPKYFEGIEFSKLAIGTTGYVTEQMSNFIEDSFNTSALLIKEAFPNRAQMPESIYSHAAIFQLSSSFASPSQCQFVIMLRESDILTFGEYANRFYTVLLDANTQLVVEDKIFILDYDIIIKAQKHLNDYIFSAQYDVSYKNSISTINNPYIKVRRSGDGYIGLFVTAKQYTRDIREENITNNSRINLPVIDLTFSQQLAGFDVFYKPPTSNEYVQLEKRLVYTQPIKDKFCYYRLADDNRLLITFSTNEMYFQPEFNSNIKVVLYLTNGIEGNFERYTGNQITAIATGENYSYNENLFIATKPLTASVNGVDKLDTEAIQSLTVEGFSTAKSITTDNDIETYFYNYKYRYGNELKVIKMRDDITERLYSAYMIMKKDDYIYPTNTSYLIMNTDDFDLSMDDNRYVLKAGHCFTYDGTSADTMRLIDKNTMAYSNDASNLANENDFVYTNLFTIVLNKKPNVVGFYMTVVNQDVALDFAEFNNDSFIQFVINSINVKRTLDNTGIYKIQLSVMPSVTTDNPIIEELNQTDNPLRIISVLKDGATEIAYLEFVPIEKDDDTGVYKFEAEIHTDDYIASNNTFRCLNLKSILNGEQKEIYIPMVDCIMDIYTLYKNPDAQSSYNRFSKIDSTLVDYQQTNMYSSESDTITFIRPMNMIRSTVSFTPSNVPGKLNVRLSSIPWVRYDIINNEELFTHFITKLTDQYIYLNDALSVIRNASHIDLKFYNTYGKSKNFIVGDNNEILDRVDLSIKFKICPLDTVSNPSDLIRDLKIYIKKFIEQRNSKGFNSAYISNLIRKIENDFPEIEFLKFLGINEYSTDVQIIRNITEDLDRLSKDERRKYVPEFLVANTDNIRITLYE